MIIEVYGVHTIMSILVGDMPDDIRMTSIQIVKVKKEKNIKQLEKHNGN